MSENIIQSVVKLTQQVLKNNSKAIAAALKTVRFK